MKKSLSIKRQKELHNLSLSDTYTFQSSVEHLSLSTDDLSWLLHRATDTCNTFQMACVLNTNNPQINILESLSIAVFRNTMDCLNILLPHSSQEDIKNVLQTTAMWQFNKPIVNALLNKIPQHEHSDCVEKMMDESIHRNIRNGITFCFTHPQAPYWKSSVLEQVLQMCLILFKIKEARKDIHHIFDRCMAYYSTHPEMELYSSTHGDIAESLNKPLLEKWVTTVPSQFGVEVLAHIAFQNTISTSQDFVKKMHLLFQHVSVSDTIQMLCDDDAEDAADYLSKQYALYQKRMLTQQVEHLNNSCSTQRSNKRKL